MIKISYLLILAVGVVAVIADGGEHNWLYPDLTDDQELLHWGGLCENGTAQSPINLVNNEALRGIFPDLEFVNYETKQSGVSMLNTGYSVKVTGFQKPMQLLKGPLHDTYVVEQIHLHWWSEHTIDNVRYPMEAHIVHRNTRYATVAEALEAKDGLTVLGVLYHLSNERNAGIDSILENLDAVKDAEQINEPVKMKNAFVTKQLFGQFDSYFNYAGSLTTPSCAESVTWVVLGNTFPVTQQQVDRFREMEFQKNGKLVNNYRVIQKTNKRAVVKVLVGNARDGAIQSASISLVSVLVTALMAHWLH